MLTTGWEHISRTEEHIRRTESLHFRSGGATRETAMRTHVIRSWEAEWERKGEKENEVERPGAMQLRVDEHILRLQQLVYTQLAYG